MCYSDVSTCKYCFELRARHFLPALQFRSRDDATCRSRGRFELADGQAMVSVLGWSIINWPLLNLEYPEKNVRAAESAIYGRVS